MEDLRNWGVTQRKMAELSGLTISMVNREINKRQIAAIPQSSPKNMRYSIRDTRSFLFDIYASKHQIKDKIHAFYNFKGGVGKTSLCYQVSSHMALLGYRVLVIDSDPQANLSSAYGYSQNMNLVTLSDVLVKGVPIETATISIIEGLDLIPSNISLTRLEGELQNLPRREEQLLPALKKVRDIYDFIFIDSNPNISLINRNAITAADVLNIVCETQPFSINGLSLLFQDLQEYFSRLGRGLPTLNIIPNKYEDRVATSAEGMTILRDNYGSYLKPDFAVRKSEDFNNSSKNSIPLAFFCKANSIAWEDVVDVIHHIIELAEYKVLEKAA